jgi:hypothetical protein
MTGTIRNKNRAFLIAVISLAVIGLLAAPAGAALTTHGRNLDLGRVDNQKNQVGSLNWGGYVAAASFPSSGTPAAGVTSVNASWKVQTAASTSTTTYSAQWTGIGGFFSSDSSLIQLGTESDYYNRAGHYDAWIEMLPNAEQVIPLTIKPGDTIVAGISPAPGSNAWFMNMTDVTTGKSYTTTGSYTSSKLSGEYIEERPELCSRFSCSLTTLANFGTAYYGSDNTNQPSTEFLTLSGSFVALGSSQVQNESIIMYANNGQTQIAIPSPLSTDGTSFKMTYMPSTSSVRNGVPEFVPERWGYSGNSDIVDRAPGPLDVFRH